MKKRSRATEHLPFRSLAFDPEYQRRMIPARVKHLVKNWNEDHVGEVTVSARDGKLYVIDGQHRVRAAMEQGLGDTKVKCDVRRGLERAEEARLFLALNDARMVSAFDKYRASLVAGDPVAIGVRDTCDAHGWRVVGGGLRHGSIACVTTILGIYDRDPELLDATLHVLTEAWGTRNEAAEKTIVAGMSLVLGRFNGEIDKAALAKKLSKYKGGPGGLLGDARGLAEFKSLTKRRAVAEVIVGTYDKGRRNNKLGPL